MRSLVQRWHYERRTEAEKCKTWLTPSAETLLSEQYQLSIRICVSLYYYYFFYFTSNVCNSCFQIQQIIFSWVSCSLIWPTTPCTLFWMGIRMELLTCKQGCVVVDDFNLNNCHARMPWLLFGIAKEMCMISTPNTTTRQLGKQHMPEWFILFLTKVIGSSLTRFMTLKCFHRIFDQSAGDEGSPGSPL